MTHTHALRVLIVDDEPGDAHLMELALKKSGFPLDLSFANDGLDALVGLGHQNDRSPGLPRPDLILLDLKMPGKGGLETLRAIKQSEHLCAIPVVVITTSALAADLAAAYRYGAAGYVLKPVGLDEFVAAVQTLATYWFGLVRLPKRPE
jgi:CheY-like chemotaxis protein